MDLEHIGKGDSDVSRRGLLQKAGWVIPIIAVASLSGQVSAGSGPAACDPRTDPGGCE